jgi:hypothetical protein
MDPKTHQDSHCRGCTPDTVLVLVCADGLEVSLLYKRYMAHEGSQSKLDATGVILLVPLSCAAHSGNGTLAP